jgi:hypothetical protein
VWRQCGRQVAPCGHISTVGQWFVQSVLPDDRRSGAVDKLGRPPPRDPDSSAGGAIYLIADSDRKSDMCDNGSRTSRGGGRAGAAGRQAPAGGSSTSPAVDRHRSRATDPISPAPGSRRIRTARPHQGRAVHFLPELIVLSRVRASSMRLGSRCRCARARFRAA